MTDASRFIPFAGRFEPVQQDQFVRQLEEMLPAFIGLAFPSLPGKVGHDDPFARGSPRGVALTRRPATAAENRPFKP